MHRRPVIPLAVGFSVFFLVDSDDYASLAGRASGILIAVLLYVLWRRAKLTVAGWLLFPYVAGLFLYAWAPKAEPAPSGRVRNSMARVGRMVHVTTADRGMWPVIQPYDVVVLEFVPEDRTESIQAVDKIDSGSLPGLKVGAAVSVTYQADNPRIARVDGGTRTFPEKAALSLLLCCILFPLAVLAPYLVLVWALRRLLRRFGKETEKQFDRPKEGD